MISSISGTLASQAALPSRNEFSAPGTVSAPAADTASPSVIVHLSGASDAVPLATYAKPAMPVWQMHSNDAVTLRIARQYNVETNTGRFSGLGAALVGQFGSDGANFAQSVSLQPASGAASTAFSLKITTPSGKAVTFALMGSEGELSVRTDTSDALDDGEPPWPS